MNRDISKKIMTLLIAILFICSFAAITEAAESKVEIQGIPKTIRMTVKQSKKLTPVTSPKSKVVFKSSDKSVVTVSKKGKLRAKKAGRAKVRITARKKGSSASASKVVLVKVSRKERVMADDGLSYFIHLGQKKHKKTWRPFKKYPKVKVTYKSSNPSVVSISKTGKINIRKKGYVTLTAKVKKTAVYKAAEAMIYITVLPKKNGLYTDDTGIPHFYYKGKQYAPGQLPRNTEIKLCKTQPFLKKFLEDYLPKYRKKINDPVEAGLTAILNYGNEYLSKKTVFNPYYIATIEENNTIWSVLLYNRQGACVYYSSLFCYLCYLSNVPCMAVEDEGHAWNILYHDGYYYSLENHYFLVKPRDHFAIPPLTKKTANIFANEIVHRTNLQRGMKKAKLVPTTNAAKMGHDISSSCPLLLYSKNKNGEYEVHFRKLAKGTIPKYEKGTPVTLSEMIHLQMESEEKNEEVYPSFLKMDNTLQDELKDFFTLSE